MSSQMSKTKMLIIGAICVALAFVLNQISPSMPQGGSITPASMLFIVLAGYWLGPAHGILAGIVMGLLDTIVPPVWFVHPVQYMLDYLLGFGALGLAGFFRNMKYGLQIGYIVGVLGRFVCVFFAGVVFWGQYAPEGQSPWLYSFIYNISYIGPEMVLTLIIISVPVVKHTIDRLGKFNYAT